MNWLEKEVPSLELCKRLKEVGYPQDTNGYLWVNAKKVWLCGEDSWQITEEFYLTTEEPYYPLGGIPQTDWAKKQRDDWYSKLQMYKAPTIRELAEWIYVYTDTNKEIVTGKYTLTQQYSCRLENKSRGYKICYQEFTANTEPDACAKMLIWLKQHGYIDFKKEA